MTLFDIIQKRLPDPDNVYQGIETREATFMHKQTKEIKVFKIRVDFIRVPNLRSTHVSLNVDALNPVLADYDWLY